MCGGGAAVPGKERQGGRPPACGRASPVWLPQPPVLTDKPTSSRALTDPGLPTPIQEVLLKTLFSDGSSPGWPEEVGSAVSGRSRVPPLLPL